MPQDPLLDQLIAQQTARQGHPLASVPANAPVDSKAAERLKLLQQLFGPDSADKWSEGDRLLRQGQLPSEVVGKVIGHQGDIELPSSAPIEALRRLSLTGKPTP